MSTLPNPYPAGPRFIHNTQRKDVNAKPEPTPAASATAPVVEETLPVIPISPEARLIARQIGLREITQFVQRVLNNEDYISQLLARIEKLEAKAAPAHLSKVEHRA